MNGITQYYNDFIRSQYKRDHAPSTSREGLSHAGRLVVLRNIWAGINTDFFTLKFEMLKDDSSPMIYNSLVFRVTTALQSLLDSTVRLCNDLYPIEPKQQSSLIYFDNYEFLHPEFNRLRVHHNNISNLLYNGGSFNNLANTIKHEVPWVGLCTVDENGVVDIFDSCHIGLVDTVLYTVLKNSSSILRKLENIVTDKEQYDRS